MGSRAQVTLVDGTQRALDAAMSRLQQLERRWSRFRSDSEISMLNDLAGRPRRASGDTLLLIELARRGWRATGGRYDPTLLAAVRHAGYDRDFARLPDERALAQGRVDHDPSSCERIVLDHRAGTVRLPVGCGFDPGGIGKGLAADLVSAQLVAAGVAGGCVNVGGDLRAWGPGPHGDRWRVGAAGRTLAVTDAAVATSGTGRRTWQVAGRRMHHLIDPATLEPVDTSVRAVTVVAPAAWQAEVYALAAIVGEPAGALADLHRWDVDGLMVDHRGQVHETRRLARRG